MNNLLIVICGEQNHHVLMGRYIYYQKESTNTFYLMDGTLHYGTFSICILIGTCIGFKFLSVTTLKRENKFVLMQ